jgi:uncharacterized membrane protein
LYCDCGIFALIIILVLVAMLMKKQFKFLLAGLLLLCLVNLVAPEASAQCAMCRATVGSNVQSKENNVGKGLNKGILYLVSIPYIMAAGFGIFWYRHSRKK